MPDKHYYLGPWRWVTEEGGEGFAPPEGVVGLVDLASLPQQSVGGSDRPLGFFATADAISLPSEYTLLGTGDLRELPSSGKMADACESLAGYRPQGDTLLAFLWDLLTAGTDPLGDDRCKPLIPTHRSVLELHLGGHSLVQAETFRWGVHPHTNRVQAVLQADFARLHKEFHDAADAIRGRNPDRAKRYEDQPLKVLDALCEKYRLDKRDPDLWRQLIPANLREHVEGPKPHETVIADTFNRADGALGSSSEGWSWGTVGGTTALQIVSNQASTPTTANGTGERRADFDLSSDDHFSQAVLVAGGGTNDFAGVICRVFHTSGTRTYYVAEKNGTNVFNLRKRVSGTSTLLRADTPTQGVPVTMRVDADGSSVSHYVGGTLLGASTDTAITGFLRCGIQPGFNTSGVQTFDNFEAGDLAGGATYNETGSGNITIGGSAAVQVTYSPAASGGASVSGSALPQVTSSQTGAGGAVLGGTSLVEATYNPAASGGVTIAGTASLGNLEFSEVGSGGAVLAGAADVQQTSSLAGSGGAVLSGTAGVQYIASVLGSGGAVLGGVAIVSALYGVEASGGLVMGGEALVADFISIAKFPGAVRIDVVGPRKVIVSRVGPGKVTVSRRTL